MIKELELLNTKTSQIDIAKKFIFREANSNVEFVYVDNHTGKDIVCTPCQTGCKLGCKFCHLTYRNQTQVQSLNSSFTIDALNAVIEDRRNPNNKTLLISFMGMGEPLLNPNYVIEVAKGIIDSQKDNYDLVRFGLATIVPKIDLLNQMKELVLENKIPLKIHWSLHQPDSTLRKEVMPSAESDLHAVAKALSQYREETGNPIEVHYTLWEGNDDLQTAYKLTEFLAEYNFPVKFIKFSERPDKVLLNSDKRLAFMNRLRDAQIPVEEYAPPGADIAGCCGEFETEGYGNVV